MQRGLDLRIAAVICAGMAASLFVSGGCSMPVLEDGDACLGHWLRSGQTASASEKSAEIVTRVGVAHLTDEGFPEKVGSSPSEGAESSDAFEVVPPPRSAEMSLADVQAWALQDHPALRLREQDVQLARARLTAAGLLPNPQLVLDTDTELQDDHTTDLTARLTFTLPTGPKRRLRTAASHAAVQASQAALCRETRTVLADVTDTAIAVLYWQERLLLERQIRGWAAQAAETQRELFKIAAVPHRDRVTAEMALGDAVLAERDAAAQLQQAQLRLARAMGIDPACTPVLHGQLETEPLPRFSLDDVLTCARSVAPELDQACCDVAASREQLAYENWRTWPDLSVGPRYRDAFADDPDRIGARVAVDLPVFDWNQGNIAAAAAQLQSNMARVRLTELATLGDVAELYWELRAADGDLEYYTRHLLPLAEETTRTIQQAFRERAVGAGELVDLLQQTSRIRQRHLDLRWQHARLRARLEILLGQPLAELAAGTAGAGNSGGS